MKYFTLMNGNEVRSLPGKKIVPAEEFTTLANASEILESVQREAFEYRKEVAAEGEKIKEAAFQEGFQEALISLNKHLLLLDQELRQLREDIQKKILPLAISASKKILGEELRLHPDRIIDIVMTSLRPVTQHSKITIYVNKADFEQLENAKPKLKKMFERIESFSIQERSDIEPGGCIIETESGIINAQLENQWRALEAAFELFMKK